MTPLTHAPSNLEVATIGAIAIRFGGVELLDVPNYVGAKTGEPSIHFHLSGVRGTETAMRDAQFRRELEEWSVRRKAAAADSPERPPIMPGVLVFEQLTTTVTDNLGTEYGRVGGRVAGFDTEWDATWVYTPAPPPKARTLRFEFSIDGESTGQYCELDLHEPSAP